jgi:hypothetical protein
LIGSRDAEIGARRLDANGCVPQIVVLRQGVPFQFLQPLVFENLKPLEIAQGRWIGTWGPVQPASKAAAKTGAINDVRMGESP